MIWHKVATAPRYAIRSACGCWQISRSGRPGIDERFSLWRRDPDTAGCTWVWTYSTVAEAKARAVEEVQAAHA